MYRKEFYVVTLTALFSMAQVWAFMVVFTTVRVSGPAVLALALTLTGAVLAVLGGWRHVLRHSRNHVDPLA